MEPIQGIVVSSLDTSVNVAPGSLAGTPAQCRTIDIPAPHAKSDDASCELIHQNQDPIGS